MKKIFAFILLLLPYSSQGNAPNDVTLLLANSESLQLLRVNEPSDTQYVIKGLKETMSCDYLYEDNIVFWLNTAQKKIQATYTNITLRLRKQHNIITLGQDSSKLQHANARPDGLACDWVNRKLYWIDAQTDCIEVSEIDGRNRKVIVWNNLDEPKAIAVDPSRGFMYWTDWGAKPKIERAGLDGSHRSVLLEMDGILLPNGLTIDYDAEKLYWVDSKHYFIYRMNLDGTGREVVLSGAKFKGSNDNGGSTDPLWNPFAVTLYGDTIYWTDWKTFTLYATAKNGSGSPIAIKDKLRNLNAIHVYGPYRQKPTPNPCQPNNGGCSHLCLLSPSAPNYSCACPTGIKLKSDNKTCEDGVQNMLLLARRPDLRMISLDTDDYTDLVLPMQDIWNGVAIDYDPVEGFVYWTDYKEPAITRAKLDGTHQQKIITKNFNVSDGIAVDWVAGNLYWTDVQRQYVAVSRLNGTSRKYIITEKIEKPRAIVVDPMQGYLYWSDWGNVSKIEQVYLDGTNRSVLVDTDIMWPNGLAIDYTNNKLFWADAYMDRIECINVDGTNRIILLQDEHVIPHVFGFSFLDGVLYWTDWQRRRVEMLDVKRNKTKLVIDQLPDLMGLKAVSTKAISGTNPCKHNNGGCSHLCLYTPQGAHCHCPTGMEILSDMMSCIEPDAFLLYLLYNSPDVHMYSLETAQGINTEIPFHNRINPSLMDFTAHDSRVYWGDFGQRKIFRSFLNGTNVETVVDLGYQNVESMAVDWLNGNIYWVNFPSRPHIEVMKLGTNSRRTIVWEGLDIARCLALDPENGYFYWSEWGEPGGIKRAEMDGSNVITVVPKKNTERSNTLTIDFEERKLYWVGIDTGVVKSFDLQDGAVETIITEQPLEKIYTLSIFKNFIYYSDTDSLSIRRADKFTGQNKTTILEHKQVADMKVYHVSRQRGLSPCTHGNGCCQHLCFSTPGGSHKCACPSHHVLNPDNTSCSPPKNFILLSQKMMLSQISIDDMAENAEPGILSIRGLSDACIVDYDVITQFVYWLNCDRNEISRSMRDGTTKSLVFKNEDFLKQKVVDFKVDGYNGYLIWTDESFKIGITRLDTHINGTVVEGDETASVGGHDVYLLPRKIAISPKHSLLFFTNAFSETSTDGVSIVKASYSGKIESVFFEMQLEEVDAIAVDEDKERIFFTNKRKIEQCSFNGKKRRQTVVSEINQPIALGVSHSVLYWIDQQDEDRSTIEKLEPGKEKTILQSQIKHLTALSVVSSLEDSNLAHYLCNVDNGGCSHICLNNKDGTTSCACPSHLKFTDDVTCGEPPTCEPNHFTCEYVNADYPPCIPYEWRCDGDPECYKGSDEKNCPICESSNSFMCGENIDTQDEQITDLADGLLGMVVDSNLEGIQCIPSSLVCNGKKDCLDGSDEKKCSTVCQSNEFPCDDGSACIKMSKTCDNTFDCADGSDENMKKCQDTQDKDNIHLLLIVISVVILLVIIVVAVLIFRKRQSPDRHEGRQVLTVTGSNANMDLRVTYNVANPEGINVVDHTRQHLASKKGGHHSTSINLSIGHSSQRVPMVNAHMPHPSYGNYTTVPGFDPSYHGDNFPLHERPHIPGASSSGSSSKYRSVTKQYLPTLNPPPSPVTDRSGSKSNGEGFYSSDSQSGHAGSCRCRSHRQSRRNCHHRGHPTTPCTSDTCDDYSYHSSASGDCRHMTSKSGRPSSPPPPYGCPRCCYMCHYHSGHMHGYPCPPVSYHSHSSHRFHGYTSSSSSSQAIVPSETGSCTRSCHHKRHHHKHRHRHPPPAYNVMSSDLNSDSDPFAPPPTPRSQYMSDCCQTHDEDDNTNISAEVAKFVNTVEKEEEEPTESSTLLDKSDEQTSQAGSNVALTEPTVVDGRLSESETANEEETILLTSRATSPSLTEHSFRIFNPPPSPATDSS